MKEAGRDRDRDREGETWRGGRLGRGGEGGKRKKRRDWKKEISESKNKSERLSLARKALFLVDSPRLRQTPQPLWRRPSGSNEGDIEHERAADEAWASLGEGEGGGASAGSTVARGSVRGRWSRLSRKRKSVLSKSYSLFS